VPRHEARGGRRDYRATRTGAATAAQAGGSGEARGGAGLLPQQRASAGLAELPGAWLVDWVGAVESACKTVVGQRLKLAGMRWREHGTDTVCHLRALFKSESGQWQAFWRRSPPSATAA